MCVRQRETERERESGIEKESVCEREREIDEKREIDEEREREREKECVPTGLTTEQLVELPTHPSFSWEVTYLSSGK